MSPSAVDLKNTIYEQFARIGKAASSPKRPELLDLLCQGERTVEVLARHADLTVANTSRHLQVLRAARLVEAERRGLYVTYRVADACVGEFLRVMRDVAEHQLAELDRITRVLLPSDDMEAVDREELLARVRAGSVTVIDVRPVEEYSARHLAGAVSVPLEDLEQRLAELPRDREIVAYCRGPFCVLAAEAVRLLRSHGFRALRTPEGVHEWEALGFPIVAAE